MEEVKEEVRVWKETTENEAKPEKESTAEREATAGEKEKQTNKEAI